MSSLSEIDRDLDQIAVDAARVGTVQKAVAARGKLARSVVDEELAALAKGTTPVARRQAPTAAEEDIGPGSGLIDVPDDVLASAELPAVLAIQQPAEPVEPLSLDLDSGETGLDDELTPVPTSASLVLPMELAAPAELDPPTETRPLDPPSLATGAEDPNADLASLLGDSDPMNEEGAEPLAPIELEPEPTTMFTAQDAERFSRPAPAMSDEDMEEGDLEVDLDEMIEIDDEPAAAERPKTVPPPPPPRTAPPPPPATGFLGKLLQRKP